MPNAGKLLTIKDEVIRLLERCTPEERVDVFRHLRKEIPIHALETDLNTTAEIILEAISRSNDITQRGIRGIITELEFLTNVLQRLEGWRVVQIIGDAPNDFKIDDGNDEVGIQVKMQRREKGVALVKDNRAIVEVQRTRTGKNASGEPTRPYRFGEFDILAVSLHPSTNDWTKFMYTVGTWLLPRPKEPNLIKVMQPVSLTGDAQWTDNLLTCIGWFRSGEKKTIEPIQPSARRAKKRNNAHQFPNAGAS